MSEPAPPRPADEPQEEDRRGFLAQTSTVLMAGGVLASYGTLGVMAARYLYPAKPQQRAWLFVTEVNRLGQGQGFAYRSPTGHAVTITRRGEGDTPDDFLALSSTCPHLGCQVHWEAHNQRFFCPCHNGVFTPEGKAIEGPPAEVGQSLANYPLKVENGLLYIEVPVEKL
ncbi:MAG: ubiquinol-cytochrome c reductase iron-sulfur subunit [Gemmataceae bacterium]